MKSKNKNLDIVKKIPNVSKYENTKLTRKNNWFNKNLAFLILTLFILLGIIIALAIAI